MSITVKTGHGTTECFQIGKGVCQGCILSPCLFNLHAVYVRTDTVDLISYIKWCDVLKSGYDVIERSVVMNFVYVMT